jgi:hypothetical protein
LAAIVEPKASVNRDSAEYRIADAKRSGGNDRAGFNIFFVSFQGIPSFKI